MLNRPARTSHRFVLLGEVMRDALIPRKQLKRTPNSSDLKKKNIETDHFIAFRRDFRHQSGSQRLIDLIVEPAADVRPLLEGAVEAPQVPRNGREAGLRRPKAQISCHKRRNSSHESLTKGGISLRSHRESPLTRTKRLLLWHVGAVVLRMLVVEDFGHHRLAQGACTPLRP